MRDRKGFKKHTGKRFLLIDVNLTGHISGSLFECKLFHYASSRPDKNHARFLACRRSEIRWFRQETIARKPASISCSFSHNRRQSLGIQVSIIWEKVVQNTHLCQCPNWNELCLSNMSIWICWEWHYRWVMMVMIKVPWYSWRKVSMNGRVFS